MKKLVLVAFLGMGLLANAQAYKGKEDVKLQIGATIQNGGTGIVLSSLQNPQLFNVEYGTLLILEKSFNDKFNIFNL